MCVFSVFYISYCSVSPCFPLIYRGKPECSVSFARQYLVAKSLWIYARHRHFTLKGMVYEQGVCCVLVHSHENYRNSGGILRSLFMKFAEILWSFLFFRFSIISNFRNNFILPCRGGWAQIFGFSEFCWGFWDILLYFWWEP